MMTTTLPTLRIESVTGNGSGTGPRVAGRLVSHLVLTDVLTVALARGLRGAGQCARCQRIGKVGPCRHKV